MRAKEPPLIAGRGIAEDRAVEIDHLVWRRQREAAGRAADWIALAVGGAGEVEGRALRNIDRFLIGGEIDIAAGGKFGDVEEEFGDALRTDERARSKREIAGRRFEADIAGGRFDGSAIVVERSGDEADRAADGAEGQRAALIAIEVERAGRGEARLRTRIGEINGRIERNRQRPKIGTCPCPARLCHRWRSSLPNQNR